jgi:hypothetical protein
VALAFIVDPAEVLGAEQTYAFGKALITTRDDFGNYLSELTVSFLRPRARRREITARPSAVFMRVRKPCFLARFRLFGWKVRFGILVQSFSIVHFGLRIKFSKVDAASSRVFPWWTDQFQELILLPRVFVESGDVVQ